MFQSSLSEGSDCQGEAGEVGLLSRTIAFMGPFIFMTRAQMGVEMQSHRKSNTLTERA